MNRQLWDMYKESHRGRTCIELFNPEKENIVDAAFEILKYSTSWGADPIEDDFINELQGDFLIWYMNFEERGFFPQKWSKDSFMIFAENYDILYPKLRENGEVMLSEDNHVVFEEGAYAIKSNEYRVKAAKTLWLSLFLYYHFDDFQPILLPTRFDIIQRNCDALGIDLPAIPRTNDYKLYLSYFYDICESWNSFQKDNDLTDAELCACIYDFASMLLLPEESTNSNLPMPTNVWLTGASGKGDFAFLDTLGVEAGDNKENIWACNERTKRGDIIVLYCTSPRSYIHSIWRSNSGGIFNPFDYYHCRTTICNGILTSHITFNDLKNDEYMSQIPIVRKNLQGINGVELTALDYSELLRLIEQKGGDISALPKLYEAEDVDFGEIKLEKDVEEKILIPMLRKLGYGEADWTRQLSRKTGRGTRAIPDFVFFAKGNKHFETAPFVIEAKLDMSLMRNRINDFEQALSYASMLHSSLMGLCDKERLIIYRVDSTGSADRNAPIFEEHWASIYKDDKVGAKLNQLIGREVVKDL